LPGGGGPPGPSDRAGVALSGRWRLVNEPGGGALCWGSSGRSLAGISIAAVEWRSRGRSPALAESPLAIVLLLVFRPSGPASPQSALGIWRKAAAPGTIWELVGWRGLSCPVDHRPAAQSPTLTIPDPLGRRRLAGNGNEPHPRPASPRGRPQSGPGPSGHRITAFAALLLGDHQRWSPQNAGAPAQVFVRGRWATRAWHSVLALGLILFGGPLAISPPLNASDLGLRVRFWQCPSRDGCALEAAPPQASRIGTILGCCLFGVLRRIPSALLFERGDAGGAPAGSFVDWSKELPFETLPRCAPSARHNPGGGGFFQ